MSQMNPREFAYSVKLPYIAGLSLKAASNCAGQDFSKLKDTTGHMWVC